MLGLARVVGDLVGPDGLAIGGLVAEALGHAHAVFPERGVVGRLEVEDHPEVAGRALDLHERRDLVIEDLKRARALGAGDDQG